MGILFALILIIPAMILLYALCFGSLLAGQTVAEKSKVPDAFKPFIILAVIWAIMLGPILLFAL